MCLWLNDLKEQYRPAMELSLLIILGMMLTTSVSIITKRIRFEHNHKKEITDYIKNEIRPDTAVFIACHPDNVAAAILPNLAYEQFYMPDINRWGSYTTWNQQRKSGLFDHDKVSNVADLARRHKGYRKYYYLTIYQLPPDSASHHHITLLKQATSQHLENAGNNWHTYYLYEIGKDD